MTAQQYAVARSFAGPWMGPAVPRRYYLGRGVPADLPSAETAVYVTEYGNYRTAYVGQTRQGVTTRLLQHARIDGRDSRWAFVWIIPVLDAIPRRGLDRIEGRAGGYLRPVECRRLPSPV
jgi:hypothetical protein